MADLTVTGEVVVTSENAEAAFERVNNKATQMAKGVENAADKASKATEGMGDGAEKSAEKFTRAESRMRDAIKRSTQELQLLGKTASEKLEFNIQAKGLDASKFAPYIEELKKAEAAQKIATGSLDKMGVSAAQTAAALRGVPAQFTDIITSLQGGQAPLTVFLQQGGQLKDMFGGAGNAAKALGGYVLGLVNPFTVAAAAGVTLAVAYNQGSKEADAYRTALVTTGNAAGTTAGQLKSYAQEISGVIGTQGKAAESLAEFVSTGRVSRDVLKEASQAAIAWERATGQAVSTTAKQFADLGKDPLQAVLKLNEGTNFLTESVYRQIKSLEEQGKTADAAAVAQRAYADALTGRAGEIERNLGSIETAWNKVKDAAKGGWDAILNVGRAETNQDKLTATRKQIADLENRLASGGGFGSTAGGAATGRPDAANNARLQAQLLGLQAQAAALEGVAFAAKTAAEAEAERAKQMQAASAWDKEGAKYLTDKAKLERDLTAARNEGLAAGKSQAEIEQRLAQIRESYAKKGGSGGIAAENKDLRDQQRIFAELADVSSTYYADLEKAQQQRAKGNLSEAQYVKYVEELIQKQPFAVAQEKARAEAIKESAKAAAESSKALATWYDAREKESQGFANQINARREEVTLIGLSAEAVVAYTQAKYEQQAAEKEAYAAALESASFYAGEYAEAYNIAAEAARNQAKQLRELGGLDVEKVNKEAAKKAKDEWQRAADDINRTLTDALMRGFESGKDFAKNLRDTVVNMFKTMVLRPVISAVVNPIAGAVTGALGIGGGGGTGSSITGGIQTASNLNTLYGAGSQALFGGAAGASAASLGYANIVGMAGGDAIGALATANGMWAGVATGAQAAAQSAIAANAAMAAGEGVALAAGTNAAAAGAGAAGAAGSSLGSMAAAAGPWVAAAAAIYAIASSLDDSGTYHTGGAAQYSAARGLSAGQSGADYNIGFGRVEAGADSIKAVGGIAQALGTALDGVAVSFGQKAGYEIATAFADDTSEDGAWGALRISKDGQELLNWQDTQTSRWAPKEFGDGEEGYKQYLAAVAKDTRQVLLDMDLPGWADKLLTSIGDSASMEQLTGVLTQIGVVQSAFVALGRSMEMFADLTDEMQSGLLDAAGSVDALTAGAGAFYQGFYSEQERIDSVVAQLNETLAGLDLSIDPRMGDDAKEQFRAAVEAAFAAGDAELAASLLAISGNFASAADYFEQLSDAAAQAAKQALDAARGDALNNLRRAVDRDRTALQDQASTLQETISGISSAVDMLRSNAADLYGTVQSTAQQLAAQGMVYVEQALAGVQAGGSVLDYTGLEGAISAARSGVSSGVYASQFERERDALVLAGQLSQLGDLSDLQLSVEERQLKAINEQIEYLDTLAQTAQDLVDGTAELTGTVESYFQQLLDLMKEPEEGENKPLPVSGIGGGGGFSSGPGSSAPVTPYNPIDDIKDLYNQTLDPAALRTTMWIRGWTVEQMAEAAGVEADWARDYLNQDLPKFAVGTNYVPKDMAAIVHEGEAIVPKAFNPWANGGGAAAGGNSELIAEVRALREEVSALRASGQAIAENTSGTPQMVRQFDQVTQGGNAIRNKALA